MTRGRGGSGAEVSVNPLFDVSLMSLKVSTPTEHLNVLFDGSYGGG